MEKNWVHKIRSYTMEKRLLADLKNENFTDVTICVGPVGNQRTFKAHRLVLASENSEFEKLLHESESGKIEIPDINPKAFENFIRYCYGIELLFRDVESVLDTYFVAQKFKANELQLAAEKVIRLLQSEFKGKLLDDLNFQLDQKGLLSKGFCPTTKNLSRIFFTKANGNTVSFEATEGESSQVKQEFFLKGEFFTHEVQASGLKDQKKVIEEHESLLKEKKIVTDEVQASGLKDQKEVIEEHKSLLKENKIGTDEVQASGLKDQKEVIVERAEAIKPEDEKMRDTDSDSDDEVIREDVVKDFMVEVSSIIKTAVEFSSGETVKKLITEVEKLSKHAAEEMEIAVADLEDSFTNPKPGYSNASQETEVESQ